ncbi:MAG: type II toxin-antitoxin system RelE/ParE family toxin [Alphaproteobacteria bacterium]
MWTVEWDESARKEFRKLDHTAQQRIIKYLEERIASRESPRRFGEGLTADKAGLWRYRVGDYRIVCKIEDRRLIVLVLRIGHRREVYE